MPDPNELLSRIEALETQVAYQDQTIEDLNKAISEQWTQFEKLQREISKLHAELEQIDASGGGEADERPPHY